MENLQIAFEAVFPFLFYVGFGFLTVRLGWTEESFMRRLNQMIFKAFFPLMMFYNIYKQRGKLQFHGGFMGICVGSVLVLLVILWIFVPKFVKEPSRTGVIIQAIYRTNTVLFAIPLMENMFGNEGALMATAVVALIVPVYNVAAVMILEYFRGGQVSAGALVKKIVTNPLISGAAVGAAALLFHIELPAVLEKPVAQFADMSTPLALFVLGATLKLNSMKKNRKLILGTVVIKMIVVPAAAVLVSILLGFGIMERGVYLILFAAPVAAASYPMAQSMGGDGDLAGELVAVTTAVSVVTIFLWIFVLKTWGLL